MDIKRMHGMIEKLSECAEYEFAKGIDNINSQEMGEVTDMMKDLAEAMYYRTLTKAMEESDAEETLAMMERFGDGRRFYDDYRYKTSGRYAPKGRGTYVDRRGFDEPPYWHRGPEYERDMDREDGRMYFTEPMESDYDKAKRMYTETKVIHNSNSTEDKEHKMKALEKYMQELGIDISDILNGMTEEEKDMMRTKLSTLVSKI